MKIDYNKLLGKLKKFPPSQKSTFPYWWNHLIAYNLIAMKWGVWRFKYLFHDIDKPFLRLFLPYSKVRKIHRKYHRHHLAYRNQKKIIWIEMLIDNECGMFTKYDSPLTAREFCNKLINDGHYMADRIKNEALPILDKLGVTF